MKPPPRWWSIQRILGSNIGEDARSELEHHIELRAEELMRRGMGEAEARAEAGRRFGDLDRVRREVEEIDRSMRRRRRLGERIFDLVRDIGLAVRGLRRNPGFAIAAILTLALAIGANSAVFSTVNEVLLRPLPVTDPDGLVMLWEENPERGWVDQTVAASNLIDWRDRVGAFADVAAYADFADQAAVGPVGGAPEVVTARMATGNLFGVLGVEPALGRSLAWDDSWRGAAPAVTLSHGTWAQLFGSDPGVVGGTIRVDGESFEIAGVLPETFALPGVEADIWLPFGWAPEAVADPSFRRAHWLRGIARLAPGVGLEAADAELGSVMAQLEAEYPETNRMMGAGLTPLHDFLVGDRRLAVVVLFAAVGLLLLLACANVGNLMLVRALGRRQELAVRSALGAGRARLIRQTMVESLVLAGIGSLAGVGLGALLVRGLSASGRTGGLAPGAIRIDATLIAYLVGIVLLTALLFGLVPALLAARAHPGTTLREGGRGMSIGRGGRRLAAGLVALEVALSFVLLVGAVLLSRSYLRLVDVDPGFQTGGILTAALSLPDVRYPSDALPTFYPRLLERLESLPGVTEAGLVRQLPLTQPSWSSDFSVDGRAPDQYGVEVLHREVAGAYFEALRTPLIRGRLFTSSDDAEAGPVILINETLAREHFAGEDPIGRRIAFTRTPSPESNWWTIVGVVGAQRQGSPAAEPRMEIFAPLAQDPTHSINVVARSSVSPDALGQSMRAAIAELDPELAIYDVRLMDEVASAATAREQFLALLLTAFGVVALALAMVGVYGVMAQSVRQRRREIGIRMALGAVRGEIVGMLTRQTMGMLLGGIAAGLAIAYLAGRALESLLYGVSPFDLATWLATPLLLLTAGLAAAALPAMRAGTDAAGVLREE